MHVMRAAFETQGRWLQVGLTSTASPFPVMRCVCEAPRSFIHLVVHRLDLAPQLSESPRPPAG